MQVGDETWAEVRLAYADGLVPLKDIAARFGLTPQRIGAKAKKDGWGAVPWAQTRQAQQGLNARRGCSRPA